MVDGDDILQSEPETGKLRRKLKRKLRRDTASLHSPSPHRGGEAGQFRERATSS